MKDLQAEEPLPTALISPAPGAEPAPAPVPPAPPRPRVWTVFTAFAAAVIGQFAAAVLLLLLATVVMVLLRGGRSALPEVRGLVTSPAVMLGVVALSGLIPAAVALLGAALSPEPTRARLAAVPARMPLRVLGVALVGGLALSNSLGVGAELLRVPHGRSLEFLLRAFQGATGALAPVAVLVVGVLAPACEELFFRGYVQSRLCRRWGPAWGIGVTAALFGLVHFDVLQSPEAFVLGLYLGWLAYRSGSILPGFVVHAVNNTLWTFHVASRTGPSRGLGLALLPLFLCGTAAAIAWLRPRLARAGPPVEGLDRPTAPDLEPPPGARDPAASA